MIELLVLLVYAVYFLNAYLQKKSRIIGNFWNSGRQFKLVIDVENFVADCVDMFLDDLFGFFLSFQQLWKVVALNLKKGFEIVKLD